MTDQQTPTGLAAGEMPPPPTAVPRPSVGRIVHYVSYGTPGGEYPSVCRAATIAEAGAWTRPGPQPDVPPLHGARRTVDEVYDADAVALCVMNPTGVFLNGPVRYHDPQSPTPGDSGCINTGQHGEPFRYCACGWSEPSLRGGTWHWPERV